MERYLTQAWFDECRQIWSTMPERPGATARIQYVIDGERPIRYWVVFEDGRIIASELGSVGAPDVTLTCSYDDSTQIVRGELDPNTAYGDGRIEFVGDMRTLMGMFPVIWPSLAGRSRTAVRYRDVHQRVAQMTEFSD